MSFDHLAPHYRWLEFLLAGGKLQRCRTAFLAEIPTPRRALLLGEGHGRGLVECRRRFPEADMVCLDASAAMLVQAHGRLARLVPDARAVEFVHADILSWQPVGAPFDLIVTNFFLDCFREEQLETIIARVAAATAPEASWLVADFQMAPRGLGRLRSRIILRTMYAFFRVVTRLPARALVSPNPMLERAGFSLHAHREYDWGLLRSDWWRRRAG